MKILLTSLLLFTSFSSNAITGNELFGYFQYHLDKNKAVWQSGIYQGYVLSISDVAEISGTICLSGGVTNGQIYDIVGKYLKDNPETRHKNAPSLVYKSLTDAYPCKKE